MPGRLFPSFALSLVAFALVGFGSVSAAIEKNPKASESIAQHDYSLFLERVNQQLSLISGNYQTLFTILGAIVGVVGIALTVATVIITVIIWRQSGEYKKMAEMERKEYFRRFDEVLDEQKKKFDERHLELKLFKQKWESDSQEQIAALSKKLQGSLEGPAKKEIESQIQQLKFQIKTFEAQIAAATISTPAVVIPEPRSAFFGNVGSSGWSGTSIVPQSMIGTFNSGLGSATASVLGNQISSHKKCEHCGHEFLVSVHSALSLVQAQCPNCGKMT